MMKNIPSWSYTTSQGTRVGKACSMGLEISRTVAENVHWETQSCESVDEVVLNNRPPGLKMFSTSPQVLQDSDSSISSYLVPDDKAGSLSLTLL